MKRRNIPILTLFIVLISTVALAQGPGGPGAPGAPGGPGGGPGQGQGQEKLFDYLQLTDEQIEAWVALVDAHREANQPLHEQMMALHEDLRAALESDTPDALTLGNLMIAIQDLRAELFESREVLEASLTALLDADQLIKYEAFKVARAFFGNGPGGPGQGPGGPGGGRGCPNC